jgi:putative ABC transport system permease protein
MAVAAVVSPLLLLFGLKYGTIETLRQRLIQDPRNREIRPLVSRSFPHTWFARMRQRADVAFVVPMTRQIGATITAAVPVRSSRAKLDLAPTGMHDPLLLENAVSIPGIGQCVLSQFAAEELQAQVGDLVTVTATRIKNGHDETGTVEFRVTGILSVRASALKAMYVPLEVLEAVERFKDGEAVSEFGWPGSTPAAYPHYHGLVVLLVQSLSALEEYRLHDKTGFTAIDPLTPAELHARTQWHLASDRTIYFLSTQNTPVGEESIEAVRKKLRGKDAILLPWVIPVQARVLDASGTEIAPLSLYVLPVSRQQAAALQLTPVPDWQASESVRQIMLPVRMVREAQDIFLQVSNGESSVTFPVSPVSPHTSPAHVGFVPAKLGGILSVLRERNLTYDVATGEFVLSRQGYAGFRLYAKAIDDVDGIRRYFADEDLPVQTEAERIKDVTDLDHYLTLLFWAIAAVGILGGTTALIASLYASVERKRRELSVLRLLGLSRRVLLRYPIYQSMLISTGGYAVAILFFTGMTTAINTWFSEHLREGESFCQLPLLHAGGTLVVTLLVAGLAATCAAWRVGQIDPAEALRDE